MRTAGAQPSKAAPTGRCTRTRIGRPVWRPDCAAKPVRAGLASDVVHASVLTWCEGYGEEATIEGYRCSI